MFGFPRAATNSADVSNSSIVAVIAQQNRPPRMRDCGEQGQVLHAARADWMISAYSATTGTCVSHMASVTMAKSERIARLAQELKPVDAEALESRGQGDVHELECAPSKYRRTGACNELGRLHNLPFRLDGAGPRHHHEMVAPELRGAHSNPRAIARKWGRTCFSDAIGLAISAISRVVKHSRTPVLRYAGTEVGRNSEWPDG